MIWSIAACIMGWLIAAGYNRFSTTESCQLNKPRPKVNMSALSQNQTWVKFARHVSSCAASGHHTMPDRWSGVTLRRKLSRVAAQKTGSKGRLESNAHNEDLI